MIFTVSWHPNILFTVTQESSTVPVTGNRMCYQRCASQWPVRRLGHECAWQCMHVRALMCVHCLVLLDVRAMRNVFQLFFRNWQHLWCLFEYAVSESACGWACHERPGAPMSVPWVCMGMPWACMDVPWACRGIRNFELKLFSFHQNSFNYCANVSWISI